MDRLNIREGATVYDANGDKLGKVINVQGQSLVVEKGFFFPTDYIVRRAWSRARPMMKFDFR